MKKESEFQEFLKRFNQFLFCYFFAIFAPHFIIYFDKTAALVSTLQLFSPTTFKNSYLI